LRAKSAARNMVFFPRDTDVVLRKPLIWVRFLFREKR